MLDILTKGAEKKPDNPLSESGFDNLLSSVRWSYSKLSSFRVVRKNLIDTYTGGSYGDGGDSGSVPLNLLELAISIYQRQLASHTPHVICDAESLAYKATAKELTLAVNYVIDKKLNLGQVINEWVIDAMFCLGIIKVGEVDEAEPRPRGFRSVGLSVYADLIAFEDWVHDVNARKYEDVDYAGHMYEVDLEAALDNPEFDKRARDKLHAAVRDSSRYGDVFGDIQERPESLSKSQGWLNEDYRKKLNLWELWLPEDDLIVTFSTMTDEVPLRVKEREGPETGPFHLLGFSPVPGNILPIAPAALWEDLMDLVNRLFLKAADQADRQRKILAAHSRLVGDMETITKTADGETAFMQGDPQMIKEFSLGGVDPGLMASLMQFKDMFSYMAGNLDSLGGLGTSADTLGQDKLISTSASAKLADMQERVVKATTGVCRDIAWYLWDSPTIDLPLTKEIVPTISRDFKWNRFRQQGEFFDYNITVTPYSLQAKSPQERLNVLMTTVNQTILPARQILQEQGIIFDFFKYLEYVAELSNVKELRDLLTNAAGQSLNQKPPVNPSQSPVTSRSYTRQNIPGDATPAGREQGAIDQFQKMAAQQQNPTQQNMMPRPGRPSA